MLATLKLLLPALIPSWRFFDAITPSPRVQFILLSKELRPLQPWQEFRPRPQKISLLCMLKQMLWNSYWNESLFIVSCSERLLDHPTKHSEDKILQQIILELKTQGLFSTTPDLFALQFRLKQVQRRDHELTEKIVYHSRITPLKDQIGDEL